MDRWHDKNHKLVGDISISIDRNIANVEEILENCNDVIKKEFYVGKEKNLRVYICYIDGMANYSLLDDFLIKPLLDPIEQDGHLLFDTIINKTIEIADLKVVTSLEDMMTGILSGDTCVFVDGSDQGIVISSKGFPVRGVSEPESEKGMRGARDSFNESLRTNTALIRRRVRDTRMKLEQLRVGTRSKTDLALIYVDDLVKPETLAAIKKKLNEISIDAVLDSGMLEHLIEDVWYSPFPQYQYTERPDKAASGILEGRVALVVDNSPGVLLLPATLPCFFQASDDYYNRFYVASFERVLRYFAALLAVGLPGLYVAIFNFHTEVLPTALVLKFGAARMGVPFPIVVEILIMELAFELLREAGVRMPGQMGNTIGVVGGLIVGQAAVEAGLVSTIVVIVVALTAIASFSIPNESFTSAFRLLKFFVIATSAVWGIYGFFLGFLAIFIHLCSLESFGVPYMMPLVGSNKRQYRFDKDNLMKWPIFTMKRRPEFTKEDARTRMK